MIDFHTHTIFSDGVLSPSEHVRRAFVAGYKVLGITDHVDFSNIEFVFESMSKFVNEMSDCNWEIKIIPGVEITHVPVNKMEKIITKARDLKIPLVIVHGESPVEPVEKGTNRAAIECEVDILAHPGLITKIDVKRAAELKVNLEISARKGHSITNGHVAWLASHYKAPVVLNTDAHTPGDFFTESFRHTVIRGAGFNQDQIINIEKNIDELSVKLLNKI